ncbi:MAG: hypothetical protein A3A94_00965 [Candidatus Portnoybacteria bacterium RIFCSPLOWO2_01_FULL_43_11]|uniref:Helix-turn-helix type 11 domain-containing protein n=4 Tax=Candidatus Portnoyibacteriota TaxID=1817913 RepID=A0A1G2FA02_9BACT|nr:MAG: hypothetical protein A2815_00800 [Candidatus Portnoybacteria bacterium RIFCSPHIGHO2_01_FULL_40_12b]OGZ36412.1 MAG: hypothetical protein A3D38_01000 [Candidatus Portnoybacteria bacterium RIFCSPHIGHO2_02_FULL_40_23]OGZ38367.1 MAG: hypothetical protein A3E90_00705 [Candidatus Portnoybacteria bacterium RIFCSPHIGHO2_12_FULL_40_11]OGZ39015.1 MAG: hypothetical protein A3A94_00965 [Candidatus Portnoybacteria bacterium RIFCSPLOWO2_01_FULL_43_11]OGZ40028.1 MAG: hypothetical protein A3I20_01395 [C
MTKKEIIWREILISASQNKKRKFTQKELAQKFHFSLSTVFNSLKTPRKIQAIEAGGRNFILRDPEKLLYLWAVQRNLDKDILYQTRVEKSVLEIEGLMPNSIIYGLYSAFRKRIQTLPADYDKVYVYIPEKNLKEIQERFPEKKGYPNLIVLAADQFLKNYGQIAPLVQIYVDLWNVSEWYAKDYLAAIKEKLDLF